MLRTMRILLLAGVLGELAASPALAQNARGMGGGGGGGQFSGGGGHGFSGGGGHGLSGGGGTFYPRMAGPGNMGGPGHMSMRGGGPYQSYGGGRQWARMHAGNDFNRDFNRMGDRRMRALAPANGGDFRRERFRGDHGRFDRRHARFDDGRHERFRHRHGNFVFFNNGWWYDEPWWNYDTAYYDSGYDGGYGGDEHAQWCADRYRSYNPADNTFTTYGGAIQECVSPFGP